MKFEELKKEVLKSVKEAQRADLAVIQALLEVELKDLSDEQLGELYKISSQANEFRWKGNGRIDGEYWSREAERQKAKAAAEEAAAADQAKNDADKRQAFEKFADDVEESFPEAGEKKKQFSVGELIENAGVREYDKEGA